VWLRYKLLWNGVPISIWGKAMDIKTHRLSSLLILRILYRTAQEERKPLWMTILVGPKMGIRFAVMANAVALLDIV